MRLGPDRGVVYVDYGWREFCAEKALVAMAGPLAHTRHMLPKGGSATFPDDSQDIALYEANAGCLDRPQEVIVGYVDALLESYWPAVCTIADALLSKGALTGAEVAQIVEERA